MSEKLFQIKFLYSGASIKDIPQSKIPEFVIVGRSNVGKSSLLNALAGQKKLAYVSQTPGRTKTINLFGCLLPNSKYKDITSNQCDFFIADLPGYGFAQSSKTIRGEWEHALQEYFEKRKNIVSIVFLIDIRRDVTQEDTNLVCWFKSLGFDVFVVQTKADKTTKETIAKQKLAHATNLFLNQNDIFSVSVHKKTGLQALCNQFIKTVNLFSK